MRFGGHLIRLQCARAEPIGSKIGWATCNARHPVEHYKIMKKGILYGLGLGPGDPELITLKAHNLIKTARVIAYPTLESGASFARSIIADSLPKEIEEITIPIPMSNTRELAQAAYDTGAKQIAERLNIGTDVLVLCEGDPFFLWLFYVFIRAIGTAILTRGLSRGLRLCPPVPPRFPPPFVREMKP